MCYAFGDYTLHAARYELRRAGVLVPVAPRAFDLLAYLVQHAGQTVSKEERFAQLWAAQFVTDSALTYCVTEVRKAIGDSGRGQRYIRTVHGRGYRFIVPVAVQQEPAAPAQRSEAPGLPGLQRGLAWIRPARRSLSPLGCQRRPPPSTHPEHDQSLRRGRVRRPHRRVAPADGAGVPAGVRDHSCCPPGHRRAAGSAAGLSPVLRRRVAPLWWGAAAV